MLLSFGQRREESWFNEITLGSMVFKWAPYPLILDEILMVGWILKEIKYLIMRSQKRSIRKKTNEASLYWNKNFIKI